MADLGEELGEDLMDGINKVLDGNKTDNNADHYFDDAKDFLDQDEWAKTSPVPDGHACKAVLYTTVSSGSSVRVWDVLILIPCLAFLVFLVVRAGHARQKLGNTNSPVCHVKALFFF